MKISVVSTVYNDSKDISRFIENLMTQTMTPDEIVIADGGSSDNTVNILEQYLAMGYPLNIQQGERLSIAQGFNKAITFAKNDLIVIMAVGNVYEDAFIEKLVKTYTPEYQIIYAPIYGKDKTVFNRAYNIVCNDSNRGIMSPSNHGVLINKDVFRKIGLFCEDFVYAGEDAEFFIRRVKDNKVSMKCCKNAKLVWNIPENIREFKKQIKAYSIGEMQWKGKENFSREIIKQCLILALIGVMIAGSICGFRLWLLAVLVVLIEIVKIFRKNRQEGIRVILLSLVLKYYRNIYRSVVYIGNKKYADAEYQIKERNIKFLHYKR